MNLIDDHVGMWVQGWMVLSILHRGNNSHMVGLHPEKRSIQALHCKIVPLQAQADSIILLQSIARYRMGLVPMLRVHLSIVVRLSRIIREIIMEVLETIDHLWDYLLVLGTTSTIGLHRLGRARMRMRIKWV